MRFLAGLFLLLLTCSTVLLAAETVSAPAADSVLRGKVVETMTSGGYCYINLKTPSRTVWVAVPPMKVQVGQEVELSPGMDMGNFHSKSLNRTFDQIIFSSGPLQQQGESDSERISHAHGGMPPQSAASTEPTKVTKATGANAYTLAELYGNRAKLNGKKVVVRGKVVKVSQGIMGRNWVHLQDGTGSATNGSNRLVVTTADTPTVGDTVTMTGTLAKDRDFGGGYRYEVILEDGAVKK